MKKNGFTMIELMSVLLIMVILALIAVPIYNQVTKDTNEQMYFTKIKNVEAKAEKYAEENGILIFDIKTLILNGELESDSEALSYIDPRNNRNMICDVINVTYEQGVYTSKITESEKCYGDGELEDLYGMVTLKMVDPVDHHEIIESDMGWSNSNDVVLTYAFKEEYAHLKDYIEKITWIGEEGSTCSITDNNLIECEYSNPIHVESVKNVTITLLLTVNVDGTLIQSKASKAVLLDVESPEVLSGSVRVSQSEATTSNNKRVDFEVTDKSGSGVKEYAVVTEKTCRGEEYKKNKKSATDGIQTEYLDNGEYYICSMDKVGNLTDDDALDDSNNHFVVDNVDTTKPTISSLKVTSSQSAYNTLDVTLQTVIEEQEKADKLQMCVSYTGFLEGCSWEKYYEYKNLALPGDYDGLARTIFVSLQDEAGNIFERSTSYTVYKNCSTQKKVFTDDNFGTCSKACGGGIQYKNYQMRDNYLETVCSNGRDQRSCNMMDCCSSTYVSSYGNYKGCSAKCGGGVEYRDVYYKSTYNNQVCPTKTNGDQRSCNTQDCCSQVQITWGSWGSCSSSCGSGIKKRTGVARSIFNQVKCYDKEETASCSNSCSSGRGSGSSSSSSSGGGGSSRDNVSSNPKYIDGNTGKTYNSSKDYWSDHSSNRGPGSSSSSGGSSSSKGSGSSSSSSSSGGSKSTWCGPGC